jgi:hypothetical protein
MTPEEKEIAELMRVAREKARGYADHFGWAIDRTIEEWGVVTALAESLENENINLFNNIKRRGRQNDPPDCEALDVDGRRIAIEVTELVNGKAIQAYKAGAIYEWADWDKNSFMDSLSRLIKRKDSRYTELKEPPYTGGYVVVIFTDEPMLNHLTVDSYLEGYKIDRPKYISRAFLLLGYDPGIKRCQYYELEFNG